MSPFTKNTLNTLIAVLYITNLTTNAMEYPQLPTNAMKYEQLQLQNPTNQNELVHIDCSIAIFIGPRNRSITYASQQDHDNILNYHHIHSTIKDPIIPLKITDNNGNNANVNLPVKKCLNLSSGSILQIYETHGAMFSKNYKKNQPLLFRGTCNTTFNKDLNDAINKFYINPSVHIQVQNQTELEDAGIIKINREEKSDYPNIKGTYTNPGFYTNEYNLHWMKMVSSRDFSQLYYQEVVKNLVAHGPNGISSEQDLIKSIISEQFSPDKNIFKSLMRQQINGKY